MAHGTAWRMWAPAVVGTALLLPVPAPGQTAGPDEAKAKAKGVLDAATQLFEDGTNRYLQDKILPFAEFNKLIGLPEIRELESRFLPQETIQKKYGSAEGLTQEKPAGH